MNRKLIMILTFVFAIAFAFGVQAEVKDPIGVVQLKPGEPIHIAYWVVISGPNTSLGTDVVRGIEIAVDDFGGSIKGWPIKFYPSLVHSEADIARTVEAVERLVPELK